MILYDYHRSSAAYRVRIALNLKDLAYEQIPVSLLHGEQQSEEHMQRNPQALVPVLEDGSLVLTQSFAICEYLDEVYPTAYPLLRGKPASKAKQRAFSLAIACDIHPINNLRVLNYLVGELGVSEEQKLAWYQHWVMQTFDALEAQMKSREQQTEFCFTDDAPSLADVFLVPQVFNANRFNVDMSRYPTLSKIVDRCNQIEAFAKAHPAQQPGA